MVTPGDLLANLKLIDVVNDAIEVVVATKEEMAKLNVEQLAAGLIEVWERTEENVIRIYTIAEV